MSNNTPNTAPSNNDNSGKPADVKQDHANKPEVKDEASKPTSAAETKKA